MEACDGEGVLLWGRSWLGELCVCVCVLVHTQRWGSELLSVSVGGVAGSANLGAVMAIPL